MQAMIERVLYSASPNKDITHATGDLATNAKPVQKLNNLPAKSAYFITKELDKLHIKANDVIMANNNLHEAYNCSITIIANTREVTDAFEQKLTSLGVSISSLTEALIDVYEANKVSYDNINVCSSHLQNSQHIITSLYGNIASVVKSLNESKSREAAKYLTKIKDLQRQIYSLQVMIDKSTKAIDTCKTDIKTNVENISTTTATMHDINNANKACHRDFRDVSEKVHKMSLASYEMSEQIAIFKNKTMELQQQAYNIGNKPVS
jgi:chromosome segregation ATPase